MKNFEVNINLSILLEDIFAKYKNKKAIQFNKDKFINYSDLYKIVTNISNYLLKFNFTNKNLILIEGQKTFETYALILSCLSIGLPYAIIDPNLPSKRLRLIIQLHKPLFFYTNFLNIRNNSIIFLNKNFYKKKTNKIHVNNKNLIKSSDTAYIMFTSGSTGEPKAVMISHNNLINFIKWSLNYYQFKKNEKILNLNAIYFDNSVFDIYSNFFSGSCLVPILSKDINDPNTLKNLIFENKCSSWFSVPSLILYLNKFKFFDDKKYLNSIKRIIFGGEGMPLSKLSTIYANHKHKINFYNVYGPTECTCICSSYLIDDIDFKSNSKLPPIGKLNDNFDYLLLNKKNEKCKPNEIGEIYLIGPCVGKGYLNNLKETENKFKIINGEFTYKTGDLMKYDSKSNYLFFIGRADNQIKHMGYRIELDEIELNLTLIKGINEAVVIHHNFNNISKLCCALSLNNKKINETKIVDELKKKLPSYMIPYEFDFYEILPKNRNGKIDRNFIKKKFSR